MSIEHEVRKKIRKIINQGITDPRRENGEESRYIKPAALYITLGEGNPEILKDYSLRMPHYWRPKVVFGISQAWDVERHRTMHLGAIAESFHCATLAIDDLPSQDNANVRRGIPSCHRYFQKVFEGEGIIGIEALANGVAVTDLAAHKVFAIFENSVWDWQGSDYQKQLLLQQIQRTKSRIIDGQETDLFMREKLNNVQDFIKFYKEKTGDLFAASAAFGGIAGGARNSTIDHLRDFGENLGVVYQIMNDIFELKGNEQEIGRPYGEDLEKKTIFYAAKDLEEVEKEERTIESLTTKLEAAIIKFSWWSGLNIVVLLL